MKPSLPDSPVKPALLSVLCSAIACAVFLVPWQRMRHSHYFGAYLVLSLVIFGAFAFLSLKFVGDLRVGIESERWPEAKIERLRTHLLSHYYTALHIGLFLAFIIFGLFLERRFRGLSWGCFLFAQTLSLLRIALKPPRPSTPPIRWDASTPIHSDHWGHR